MVAFNILAACNSSPTFTCLLHQRCWVESTEEVAVIHIVNEICQTPLSLSLSLPLTISLSLCLCQSLSISHSPTLSLQQKKHKNLSTSERCCDSRLSRYICNCNYCLRKICDLFLCNFTTHAHVYSCMPAHTHIQWKLAQTHANAHTVVIAADSFTLHQTAYIDWSPTLYINFMNLNCKYWWVCTHPHRKKNWSQIR